MSCSLCISQFQLRPAPPPPPPPPPPPGYCRAFARFAIPGGGAFANFVLPGGRGFANPRAIPDLLTRTRFPIRIYLFIYLFIISTIKITQYNITTQRILLGKKADWLICQDRKKLETVVKACSWFYACISSLLVKPEYIAKSGAIDVNQRFWVIQSNFYWHYLKNILSYL